MEFPLSTLQLAALDAQQREVGRLWSDFKVLNDPFGRIYWLRWGRAVVRHHDRQFRLQPGRLYIIPAHTPSRYFCPKGMELCWIHYTAKVLGSLDLFHVYPCRYEVIPSSVEGIDALWQRIFAILEDPSPGAQLECESIATQFLAMFISPTQKDPERIHQMERFRQVLAYIDANIGRKLTLAELGGVMHLQPTYFSNLFTKHLGMTPIQYINQRRVERAQQMLLRRSETIQEIAEKVSFEDAFYFSRLFKKIVGVSPAEYRNQPRQRP